MNHQHNDQGLEWAQQALAECIRLISESTDLIITSQALVDHHQTTRRMNNG